SEASSPMARSPAAAGAGCTPSSTVSPSTPSMTTAARRSPSASTSARSLRVPTGSPSNGRASTTGRTLPRRFMTPITAAGAPGTGVVVSSTTTSRASVTSTANGRPPSKTTQARPTSAASGASANSAGTGVSVDKSAHHREQLVGGEGLAQIVVGALAPPPGAVALLVLGGHEHDRRRARVLVALERAQQLVAVTLRHDDVQQEHVGTLVRHLVLQRVAVDERDDLMPGAAQDRLHELQLGVGVVDDHHLRHRLLPRPARHVRGASARGSGGCNAIAKRPPGEGVRKANRTASDTVGPWSSAPSRHASEARRCLPAPNRPYRPRHGVARVDGVTYHVAMTTPALATERETLERYEKRGALLRGHFRLTSGLHSDIYLQSALVLQHPEDAAVL